MSFDTPPPTTIDVEPDLWKRILESPVTVLCGRNNSGKSFVLRRVLKDLGRNASYLGPARYQNFTTLSPYGPREDRRNEKWRRYRQFLDKNNQNVDNSPLNLQQAIAEISDDRRDTLFQIVERLLGSDIGLAHTIPGNEMSQKFIRVDGFNLSFTSSGFRLVTTLVTALLDLDYSHFLIDEPELGLSPEIQGVFADFLLDPEQRAEHFPHLKSVVLATHSPIFLDRRQLRHNYRVEKSGSAIQVHQLTSLQELNTLQFRLLGNRFDTLYLPSAIVLVEGKTDHAYLARILALRFPGRPISTIRCDSDSRMRAVLQVAAQMLGDIKESPYADRFFAVLDQKHEHGLVEHLTSRGVPREHIVIWSCNGIEHLYPRSILEERFGVFDQLLIEDDVVRANGREVKKVDLCDFVVARVTPGVELPEEIETRFVRPLEIAITPSRPS